MCGLACTGVLLFNEEKERGGDFSVSRLDKCDRELMEIVPVCRTQQGHFKVSKNLADSCNFSKPPRPFVIQIKATQALCDSD